MLDGSIFGPIALLLYFEAKRQEDTYWKVICYILSAVYIISWVAEVYEEYLA